MYNNISISGRVFRIALSTGLILTVLNSGAPLGAMVFLAFASIYAGITGFIGWKPINKLASVVEEKMQGKTSYARQGNWLTQ